MHISSSQKQTASTNNQLATNGIIIKVCIIIIFGPLLGEFLPQTLKLALESLHGLGGVSQRQVLPVIETSTLRPVVRSIDDKGIIDHCELVVHEGSATMIEEART